MSSQSTRGSGARQNRRSSQQQARPRGTKPSAAAERKRQAAHQALLAARQDREQRARRLWIVLAPIGVAVLVVTALVAVKLGSNTTHTSKQGSAAEPAVVARVTNVPASAFDAVGAGSPYALPSRIDDLITAGGKPRILYVGAEYCPYCAVERWPVIVALSRFGTWSGLRYAYSAAAPEPFPNTATFSFHGASYTSQYLSFTGVETETNQNKPLDTISNADLAIFHAHDPRGATPFIDLAGKHVIIGATYDPKVLVGHTQAQIAASLADPASKIGAGVLSAANVITASLCEATGGQPANVCTSPGVTAAAKVLP